MRTTLDLDADVLMAASGTRGRPAEHSRVISDLVRKALTPTDRVGARNGVPLLPRRAPGAPRPTLRLVNALRDDR